MLGGIHPEAAPFWYAQGQGLGYGEAFVITARRAIEAVMKNDTHAKPSFDEALHVTRIIDARIPLDGVRPVGVDPGDAGLPDSRKDACR